MPSGIILFYFWNLSYLNSRRYKLCYWKILQDIHRVAITVSQCLFILLRIYHSLLDSGMMNIVEGILCIKKYFDINFFK